MYYLVLDCSCNRVIYFTDTSAVRLTLNQHVYLREWDADLPVGMSIKNCWDWKLIGNKLILDQGLNKNIKKSLIEQNKEKMLKFLTERVNHLRKPFLPTCSEGYYLRSIKLKEAINGGGPLLEIIAKNKSYELTTEINEVLAANKRYKYIMLKTEIFRELYKEKIHLAQTNEEVYKIRDEIAEFVIDSKRLQEVMGDVMQLVKVPNIDSDSK